MTRRVLTPAGLFAAPLLLLWPLRAQTFGTPDMVDPYLSTAVIQHGRDLVERFGDENRRVTRAGFTVPGRIVNSVFGDLGGYYAFRYVLVLAAIIPAFLLFSRLRGRPAGAIAVAALVANPAMVRAWNNDFPTASGVTYLGAAYCCLAMPTDRRRDGVCWIAAGGSFLTLAVYSHAVSVPLVGVTLVTFAVSRLKEHRREILADGLVLLAVFGATTLVLSVASNSLFNVADLWSPTFDAFSGLRSEEAVALYHSSNWRWVLDTPHLLVPLLIILMWFLLSLRRTHGFSGSERYLWWTLLMQLATFTYLQFFDDQWVLEFHYYFSLIWPLTALVGASTICELGRALLSDQRWCWVSATVVFAVPLLLVTFTDPIAMSLAGAALLVGVAVAGTFALSRLATARRSLFAIIAFVTAGYLVLVAQSPTAALRDGQAALPKPSYAAVFANHNQRQHDLYAVASDLHKIVPKPARPGTPLLIWARRGWSQAASLAAAQYGWMPNVMVDLPQLMAPNVSRIDATNPDVIVLLSEKQSDLSTGTQALGDHLPGSSVLRAATLRHGDVELHVQVVATGLVPVSSVN